MTIKEILSDIGSGIIRTFEMDDVKSAKPRRPVCRECEILGAGAAFTGAAYSYHLTRHGRIMPYPGMMYTLVLGCLGMAMLVTFPPDGEVTQVLLKMKSDIEKKEQEAKLTPEDDDDDE